MGQHEEVFHASHLQASPGSDENDVMGTNIVCTNQDVVIIELHCENVSSKSICQVYGIHNSTFYDYSHPSEMAGAGVYLE
jgi:hypothetical protein